MTRLVDAWGSLVAVLAAGMGTSARVYRDRPPRLETPAVFPVLLPSRTERPDICTVRDTLQVGVTLVVAEADTAERGDTFRPLFDQLLDTLDAELARQAPFGAQGTFQACRRTSTSSRSAPAALSIALLTSIDFGNPVPYSQQIVSRISNPASSMPQMSRWWVRVPPNASKCPPGFRTRSASDAHASHHSA